METYNHWINLRYPAGHATSFWSFILLLQVSWIMKACCHNIRIMEMSSFNIQTYNICVVICGRLMNLPPLKYPNMRWSNYCKWIINKQHHQQILFYQDLNRSLHVDKFDLNNQIFYFFTKPTPHKKTS